MKSSDYEQECIALAERVVARFSPEEMRAILVQNYAVNYFQYPDAYDDDLNMIESKETDT